MDHTKPLKREDVRHLITINGVFNFAALTRGGWLFPSGPPRQKFLGLLNFMLRLDKQS
jgi:hypothetical protein